MESQTCMDNMSHDHIGFLYDFYISLFKKNLNFIFQVFNFNELIWENIPILNELWAAVSHISLHEQPDYHKSGIMHQSTPSPTRDVSNEQ